jgi:HEAT repeats
MSFDSIGKVFSKVADKATEFADPADKAFKAADKAKKFADDYQARSHSQKTYPQNLQHRYGKLTIPGLSGCNSIDLLDMFVDLHAIEKYDIGQPEQEVNNGNSEPEAKSESALGVLRKQEHRCVVILGGQGSGKSTLVRYLALDWARWAEQELKRWGGQKMTIDSYLEASLGLIGQGKTPKQFPILIELREYINNRIHVGESFREFWHRGIASDRKLSKEKLTELNNKNISVIFDGLNEIGDPRLYSDTVRKIIEFATIHPLTKIIVTSREIHHDGISFENANFWHFKLEDFDDLQTREIVDNWCSLTTRKDKSDKKRRSKETSQKTGGQKEEHQIERKKRKQRLLEKINKFPSISVNPQFLMMTVGILDDNDDLPTEKELYDRLSQMLLASSSGNGIDGREKQVILGRIAYEMQFGSPKLDGKSIDYESLKQLLISHLDLKKIKDPNAIAVQTIGELERDRFIICVVEKFDSEDIYNFVNPKFLAYFCAKEVKIKSKTSPLQPSYIFKDYWQKENRHESLRSICGALDPKPALELVSFLMDRKVDRVDWVEKSFATKEAIQHLCLARECLEEIKNYNVIDSKINENLKEKLKSEIKPDNSLNREAAKKLTDSIAKYYRESSTLQWLKDIALKSEDRYVRSAAVQSIAEYYHYRSDDSIPILLQKVATQDPNVTPKDPDALAQQSAIKSLAYYYHTKKDLKLELWQGSRSIDRDSMKRGRSSIDRDSKKYNLLAWLKDCFDLAPHHLVRRESVRAIAKYYHHIPDTSEWLRDYAMHDSHEWVRASAVQELASYYHKEPGTLKLLSSALDDKHKDVKQAAVRVIAKHYRIEKSDSLTWSKGSAIGNNPHPLICLRDSALSQKDLNVRKVAMELIAKYDRNKEALTFMKTIAENNNEEESIRAIAVRLIDKYYKDRDLKTPFIENEKLQEQLISKNLQHNQIPQFTQKESLELPYGKEENNKEKQQSIVKSTQKESLESLKLSYGKEENNKEKRQSIVKSIAKYYRKEPGTLAWLKDIALNDKEVNVRLVAVESIAKYYHKNADTLASLKDIAIKTKEVNVVLVAVESIAKYYHKNAGTLEWLKKIAFTDFASPDKEADVRQAAKKLILNYYYQKNPGILDRIQDFDNLLYSDGLLDVEHAVVRSISKPYYQAENATRSLIQDAVSSPDMPLNPFESIKKIFNIFDLSLLKELVLSNPDPKIKFAAIEKIAKHYRKEDRAWKWLKDIAERYDINRDVRLMAIKSIAKYYRNHSTKENPAQLLTLEWLKDLTKKADDSNVRRLAVESIAKYYYKKEKESNPINWLKECVRDSEDEVVWKAALESIPKHYKYYNEKIYHTFRWLDFALNNELVLLKRLTALQQDASIAELESIYKEYKYYNDEIYINLEWLKDIAKNKKLVALKRSAALQSIAKYYWDESGTLEWLKKIAENQLEHISLRADAVKSIAQYYHKKPEILTWLKEERFLYKENNPKVRSAIVESIAKYYRKKSFVFTLLKECALNDHEPLVRSASIRAINEYFPKNNEVDKILQLVIDRDIDRDIDDEDYPKAVAVQILKDKYR